MILGAGRQQNNEEKKKVEGDTDQPSPPSRPSPAPRTLPCWLPFSQAPAESGAPLLSCPTLLEAQVLS